MEIINKIKGNPEIIIVKTRKQEEFAFDWNEHDTGFLGGGKYYQIFEEKTGIVKLLLPVENIEYIMIQ